ncbi:YpmS family protein [Enterococcus sp. CWB-B31]|uniref:YpmS family protein n=1 Tax=Enterococcus sp. CWB-B31 TaxID=2885159 RepID=UPI003B63BCA2
MAGSEEIKSKKTKKKTKKMKKTNSHQNSQPKKKLNPWKIACLTIIGILAGIILFIGIRVTQVREPNINSSQTTSIEGTPVLSIQSNKQQINSLIEFFLNEFQKDTDITYDFYLENEAMLTGTFKVLGYPIQFNLYFDPYVVDGGNVQLKAKSLSVGTLGLPIKDILNFVKRDYNLPGWVEVNPSEKYILLKLDEFRMQNGLFIRAEKINLIDDDIRVNLYLPSDNEKNTETSNTSEE